MIQVIRDAAALVQEQPQRMVLLGVLNINNFEGHIDPQARCLSEASGAVQKSSSSPALSHAEGKAAVIFARGAYFQYVSTEKWRQRRWRLFSTAPC